MIKTEDRFHSFCGCSFISHKLNMAEKYKIVQWIYGKDDFYIAMYDKHSMSKTTYYAKLKQR